MMHLMEQKRSAFNLLEVLDFEQTEKLAVHEEQEQRIKAEADYDKFIHSGVPDKFFKESFDTFIANTPQEELAKGKIQSFANHPEDKVLMMYGGNGCGKSHLASSIIRQCGGVYILSSKLCVKFDSATSFKAKMSREEILDYYSECGMLVIDECCKYYLNPELEKFLLAYILCERYANKLPTVFVTNSAKNAFTNFMGKAVMDRFNEVCISVEFNWQSKRQFLRRV